MKQINKNENIFNWIKMKNDFKLWCCSCYTFTTNENMSINVLKFNNKECNTCFIRKHYYEYFLLLDKLLSNYNISVDITRKVMKFLA